MKIRHTLLAAAVFTAVLAGCNKRDEAPATPAATPPAASEPATAGAPPARVCFVMSRKISNLADGMRNRVTAIIDALARLMRLPVSLMRASQSRRNETYFCLVEYQPVPRCCPQ